MNHAPQPLHVAPLGREHAHLAGHRGEHQDRGVDRRERHVEQAGSPAPTGPGRIERSVKYIANSAAKNISSLESQTMVPTETMFGRFTWA